MKSKVIETSHGRTWLEDGIIRTVSNPNIEHTLADARKNVEIFFKLANGIKRPLLSDISNVKSVSREAREYFAGEETAKVISAIGLLINSPVSRVIGNFYLSLNKPPFPVKLFISEKKAIRWLKTFLSDINGK
jgi:hypothetical protein